MKQWTNEDLILFYYHELDENQAQEVQLYLSQSHKLRIEYDELCLILDNELNFEVPEHRKDLTQQIMARVHSHETQKNGVANFQNNRKLVSNVSFAQKLANLLRISPQNYALLASLVVMFFVVGIFFVGRWSADVSETLVVKQIAPSNTSVFGVQASRRILLSNMSSHMETGQRLLTMVSNGDEINVDLESRQQMVDELIGFNRVYRRLAEQSEDKVLANVLRQMELILLEIDNADINTQWNSIRERLDDSDLLFKLKVSNKKINQEII